MTKSRSIGMLTRAAILLAAFCAAGASTQAAAQPYPSRTVRIMVGFPPGGGTDLTARLVAQRLSERLGQPVIVENRVGAGGNIAMEALAKAPPDGYLLAVSGSLITINATLQPKLPFDPLKDFAPITMLVNNPLVLFANPSFPAKDVRQLVALARAQPGQIAYGSAGAGTAMHLVGAMMNLAAGIDLVHVAYKGNGPVVNDVLGGQIPLAVADLASTLSFAKAGRLHLLGVAGARRSVTAPDIPTIAESGIPGFQVQSWTALIAPARTPPEVINRLSSNVRAILESPEVRDKLLATGLEPAPTTPEELGDIIRSEIVRWAKVIKDANIKPDG
jgi:tripartite-type tricarboxylate transporter receptor subunit TctC